MKTKKFTVTIMQIRICCKMKTIEADSYEDAARRGTRIGGAWMEGPGISNVCVTDILPHTRKYDSSQPGLVSIDSLPEELGLGYNDGEVTVRGLESLGPEFWARRQGDEIAEGLAEPQAENKKPGLR